MADDIEVTRPAPGIAVLTFTGRSSDNFISRSLFTSLCQSLQDAGADPAISVIILRAAGENFSRGVDLQELAGSPGLDVVGDWKRLYAELVPAIWHNRCLVIATVRGDALGLGCELALLADLTFADETACFGHPEFRDGFLGRTIWPYLVGPKISKEYLASGRLMSARTAAEVGLINRTVPPAELDEAAFRYARKATELPSGAVEMTKKRVGWAYRDVSRSLYDDLFYDMPESWIAGSRSIDIGFYDRINEVGLQQALQERDRR
jgi:enoyl-CoA hydratase/carnithine racemase